MTPRCRICSKPYTFPDCELEAVMYPRPATPGPWGTMKAGSDREKFQMWLEQEIGKTVGGGGQPTVDQGLGLILLGRKEGLKVLAPHLAGTTQHKWDFMVKRLFPFNFQLTHARPGGYETERVKKWLDANYEKLKWDDTKKAFVVGR